jgi:nucleoside-diphosphate-sugar epimerase
MKILIIGASGFIGKNLVRKLAEKHQTRSLVRKTAKEEDIIFLKNCKSKIFYGDALDQESLKKAMKGIDAVINLAGGGNVSTTFKSGYDELKEKNLDTLKGVLEAAKKMKIKRFMHFSSISAMGIILEKELDETTECQPLTPHEVCKLETEKILEEYKKDFLITIIRPGIVYGPFGEKSEVLDLVKIMKKHFMVIPGKGNNLMPWVYVEDVVGATILALEKNKESCERYIIVSSPEPTFNELINSIKENLGLKVLVFHIPKWIFLSAGYLLEKIGDIFNFAPTINSIRAKSMTSNRIYNTKKIKELGFKSNINFKDSMKVTMEYYKQHGDL